MKKSFAQYDMAELGVVSTNPEIILMRQQDDEQECDIEESMWYAGTAVTKTKSNDY